MANLENKAARCCQRRQLARVGGVVGDRLFDQQMFSASQKFAPNFEMGIGRGDDTERLGGGYGLGH